MEKLNTVETFSASLFIGSNERYGGTTFLKENLVRAIGDFQDSYKYKVPVRITDTSYIMGRGYQEDGWELTSIVYPRRENDSAIVKEFMEKLAEFLLTKFNQNRITVQCMGGALLNDTFMIQNDQAS